MALILIALCALAPAAFAADAVKAKPPEAPQNQETNLIASAKYGVAQANYRLVQGDKVEFRIEEDPSKQRSARMLLMNALGDIRFPVSLDFPEDTVNVRAKGRTFQEIEQELKEKLEADYYHKATVKLRWVEQGQQKPGQALFTGSIRGAIPLLPGEKVTLMEAIMRLNYNDFVNLKSVELNRIDPATGVNEKKVIDVKEIMSKNKRENDVELKDGDLIRTKDNWLNF